MDVRGERHTTLGLFLAGQYHMHCIREEYGDSWYEYYGADKLRVG